MAAASTDLFQEVGIATATTLDSNYTIGDSSITVASTASMSTATGITFCMDVVDGDGVQVPGSYNEYVGVVSTGTSITSVSHANGTNRNYSAGATTRVFISVSEERENRLVEGILTHADQDGTLKAGAVDNAGVIGSGIITNNEMATAVKPVTLMDETTFDFVASELVWSGDSYGSTRNASMTAGVVYIDGVRVAVSAITARSFTASRDTYIDVGSDGVVDYTEVTNNNASPALSASHIRIGIIVTGASNIANVGSVNQGEEDKILPIASSIAYTVTDSLGNLICPRDPTRKVLGYRQKTSNTGKTSTNAAIAGLSAPVIIPTGRKIKITAKVTTVSTDAASDLKVTIYDTSTAGTALDTSQTYGLTTGVGYSVAPAVALITPTATSKTYIVAGSGTSGNQTYFASATSPFSIRVELA